MSPSDGRAALDGFLASLAQAPARVLLLDYDGTLAPFHLDRDRALPAPGVRAAIEEILAVGRTRVVVVSGRAVADLRRMLGIEPPPELWGTHGWERMERGGEIRRRAMAGPAADALARAASALEPLALGHRLEVKPAALAVHTRGLPDPEADRTIRAVREGWRPIEDRGVEIHRFDGGVELRVRGWDKGDAVRAVLAEEPVGTAAAYLGDDATDEDAFRALTALAREGRVRAMGILVREAERETAAELRIPPAEVVPFLRRWRSAEE